MYAAYLCDTNNNVHIYMATGCRHVSDQELDFSEFLNVELVSEDDLRSRIFGGDFLQSLHIMAWYLAKEQL